MEVWKDIKGYEGWYQVSNTGHVRSLDRYVHKNDGVIQFKKGHTFAGKLNTDGYPTCVLARNGDEKIFRIHRLVAIAFVANPNNYPEINHKDCNRQNNNCENLEWCTHQYNIQYAIDAGHHKCCDCCGAKNSNYDKHTLHDYYAMYPEEAMKLGRPGSQNGRAIAVVVKTKDGELLASFDWIGGCAKYCIEQGWTRGTQKSVSANIATSIRKHVPYLSHWFIKI